MLKTFITETRSAIIYHLKFIFLTRTLCIKMIFIFLFNFSPDQTTEVLCDYVHQMGIGQHIELNCVAYDCSNHLTNVSISCYNYYRTNMVFVLENTVI